MSDNSRNNFFTNPFHSKSPRTLLPSWFTNGDKSRSKENIFSGLKTTRVQVKVPNLQKKLDPLFEEQESFEDSVPHRKSITSRLPFR